MDAGGQICDLQVGYLGRLLRRMRVATRIPSPLTIHASILSCRPGLRVISTKTEVALCLFNCRLIHQISCHHPSAIFPNDSVVFPVLIVKY